MSSAVPEIARTLQNPLRSAVLQWYRKCLKAAFEVPWTTDADALYVLEETRRTFRRNERLREVAVIERKLREVEMRYELALHYRIPYPRPYNKAQGGVQSSSVSYVPYMDSAFDSCATNPSVGQVGEGDAGVGFAISGGRNAIDCDRGLDLLRDDDNSDQSK